MKQEIDFTSKLNKEIEGTLGEVWVVMGG